MAASLCFYKVKEGMFKKLLHDPRHSFCNLLVLDNRQRKTSYFIRPVLRPTFRKEQVSYHGGKKKQRNSGHVGGVKYSIGD